MEMGRKTNMKNVKVILISVVLCATVFANSRIAALGGDAAGRDAVRLS